MLRSWRTRWGGSCRRCGCGGGAATRSGRWWGDDTRHLRCLQSDLTRWLYWPSHSTTNHPALENCPPNDSEAASGDVYRCAKNNPPHTEDMKTHEESGRRSHARQPSCTVYNRGRGAVMTWPDLEPYIRDQSEIGCLSP